MKQYIYTFSLLFYSLSLFAQSNNWKKIDSPISTSYNLIYQSSKGYLFCNSDYDLTSYISMDNGVTWQKLSKTLSYYTSLFKEDSIGNIYLNTDDTIFQYNASLNTFKKVFVLIDYYIDDFELMKNGDIITISYDKLRIYNITGSLKKSRTISNFYDTKIHINSVNDTNLLISNGFPTKFIKFTSSFSYFSNEFTGPDAFDKVVFSKNRIFLGNQYSDDGVNWHFLNIPDINNKQFSDIIIGPNNKVLFYQFDSIYISNDNGNTFEGKKFNSNELFSYNAPNQLLKVENYCSKTEAYTSSDEGLTWYLIPYPPTNELINYFAACNDEVIFLKNCSETYKYNNGWIIINQPILNTSEYIFPIKDITILAIDNNKVYRSNDNGSNWLKVSDEFNGYPNQLINKKDIIFGIDLNTIVYSIDEGSTWKSNKIEHTTFLNNYAISKNKFFYYSDFINYDSLLRLDLNTNTLNVLNYQNIYKISDIQTGYNNENLYIIDIEYNSNGNFDIFLNKSTDLGSTFTTHLISENVNNNNFQKCKILVDHSNNLIVYNNKFIFISKDDGKTWINISPTNPELININELQVSFDSYIYISTYGAGILKFNTNLNVFTNNQELDNDVAINIAPNPTNSIVNLNIQNSTNQIFLIKIYNTYGECCKEIITTSPNEKFDLSNYPSGIYIIEVKTNSKTYSSKIVKI